MDMRKEKAVQRARRKLVRLIKRKARPRRIQRATKVWQHRMEVAAIRAAKESCES